MVHGDVVVLYSRRYITHHSAYIMKLMRVYSHGAHHSVADTQFPSHLNSDAERSRRFMGSVGEEVSFPRDIHLPMKIGKAGKGTGPLQFARIQRSTFRH